MVADDLLGPLSVVPTALLMLAFTVHESRRHRRTLAIAGGAMFLACIAFEGSILADLWRRGRIDALILLALATLLMLFAWRLVVSPLARVRTKLAFAYPFAIVCGLGMLFNARDDWRRGRAFGAAANVAAEVYWANWMTRCIAGLQNRRDALLFARKQRRQALAAAAAAAPLIAPNSRR